MRAVFSVIFFLLILALILCAVFARRSHKPIGQSLSILCASLIFPVLGNLILVISRNELLSFIGSHVYVIGMDLMAFSLIDFTMAYCNVSWRRNWKSYLVYTLLTIDIIQIFLNPFFGHVFAIKPTIVEGSAYYQLVPFLGLTYHRIAVYATVLISMIMLLAKSFRVPRIYAEKYYVILLTLLLAAAWQTYYIFAQIPIDRSMVGIGAFGIILFYVSLFYRPFRVLDRMLASVASKLPEAIFFFDTNRNCIWANEHGLRLVQLEEESVEKAPALLSEMFSDFNRNESEWTSKAVIGSGKSAKYYTLKRQNLIDAKGSIIGSFFSIQDNTKIERQLQQDVYNASHDRLTGLLNKDALFQEIREKVRQDSGTPYWIAYFDIKDFKIINDIFGKEMGDFVLQKIAKWLRVHSSSNWIFGRLTGDAFGICFPSSKPNVRMVEQQISKFVISNGSVDHNILIHVGLYKVTDPDIDVSIMFDRAHVALNTVKGEFNHHVAVYDNMMRDQVLWDQKISAQLEKAIKEKQLQPYLQPIVDNQGKIIGSEALVRWIHPEEGFLPPIKFIPVFEQNGMIAEVDKYIWRCACEILASWTGDKSKLFISINISPKDFYFMDVYSEIMNLVKEYRIEPSRLRVEITESVMMTDIENRIAVLNKFRESDFIVEMDDFGSGYSSLNQLKDMPLDGLKIDMKFLSSAINDKRSETILRYVLRMSQELGLFSLTEGVETKEQYDMLNEMGCNLFQGYYFAKPMPLDEFEKLIAKD